MNADTALHLRQAAAWCIRTAAASDLGSTTRTAAICPDLFASCDDRARLAAIHGAVDALQCAVQQICDRRALLVEKQELTLPSIDYCLVAGRLFCTDFDTDSCEAATGVSNGFFDPSDIPGWDTWFAYERASNGQRRVYGWIPNEIAAPVGLGMWAIPVQCVWWVGAIPDTAR